MRVDKNSRNPLWGTKMRVLFISSLQTRKMELLAWTENTYRGGRGGAGLLKANAEESWPSRALSDAAGRCVQVGWRLVRMHVLPLTVSRRWWERANSWSSETQSVGGVTRHRQWGEVTGHEQTPQFPLEPAQWTGKVTFVGHGTIQEHGSSGRQSQSSSGSRAGDPTAERSRDLVTYCNNSVWCQAGTGRNAGGSLRKLCNHRAVSLKLI